MTPVLRTTQKGQQLNTRIGYRYADKTNCRQYTAIVVEGVITWEQIEPYLATQQSFIPGQVGLEDLQYRFALPGADHPWHQIEASYIKPTEAEPTVAISAEDLAWSFAHTPWNANASAKLAPALFKESTVENKIPARTPAEKLHSIKHTYAQDKQPSEVRASRTPARQR